MLCILYKWLKHKYVKHISPVKLVSIEISNVIEQDFNFSSYKTLNIYDPFCTERIFAPVNPQIILFPFRNYLNYFV